MPERTTTIPNVRWSLDFSSDRTRGGSNLRILTVIDEVTGESLALEVDDSLTGRRAAAALNRIALFRGLPKEIQTNNGSEFISNFMNAWAYGYKIDHIFTDPGKPTQNGYTESFNGNHRSECLSQHWFKNVSEARDIVENWRLEYNRIRSHSSLENLTPQGYALKLSRSN